MRIRIHKSRGTTSAIVAISLVFGIGIASAVNLGNIRGRVADVINKGVNKGIDNAGDSNSNRPESKPFEPGSRDKAAGNSGELNGQSCLHGKVADNLNGNGEVNGNAIVRDCEDLKAPTISPSDELSTSSCKFIIKNYNSLYTYESRITKGNGTITPQDPVKSDEILITGMTAGASVEIQVTVSYGKYTPVTSDFKSCYSKSNGAVVTKTNVEKTQPAPEAPTNVVITLSSTPVVYNGARQSVQYTVDPSNATCRLTYNDSVRQPINAGVYQVVVTCTANGYSNSVTGTFIVNKAPSPLTWEDPKPITTSTPLSPLQLRARSTVPGTYSYTPAAGSKLPAGTRTLKVDFTPRAANNYLPASTSVRILVTKVVNQFKPIKVPFNYSDSGITAKASAIISSLLINSDISEVTVTGYAQPSKNKNADLKLSLARANEVARQLKAILPDMKMKIVGLGSKINPTCAAEKNKCVIIS